MKITTKHTIAADIVKDIIKISYPHYKPNHQHLPGDTRDILVFSNFAQKIINDGYDSLIKWRNDNPNYKLRDNQFIDTTNTLI